VQIPGSATRISRRALVQAIDSASSIRGLMTAYVHAFLEQVLVSAACNGAHSLRQRLARWLLMMRDRSDSDVMLITQTLLAEMLGAQRPSITNIVRAFEAARLVKPGRGKITLLNRQGLMKASCECYQLVRARTSSHLPKTYT
jgi:CRP-like cAMP-binding protein